jgi:hypothetical protein
MVQNGANIERPRPPDHVAPGHGSPINNLHTMVRAPQNNPVKDQQRSKWMSSASQNASAMLPLLSSLLDDGRADELQPLSPSFTHSTDSDPNNLADVLRHLSPVPIASREPASPSKSPTHGPGIKQSSLFRVMFSDALPPHVLQAAQPLFAASLSGASAPDFIASLGAALRQAPSPTRFYFIVYFDAQSTIDAASDNIAVSSCPVLAVACYWITSAFDMAR